MRPTAFRFIALLICLAVLSSTIGCSSLNRFKRNKRYKAPKLAELLLRDHLLGEVQRWYAPEVLVLDGAPLINLLAWARIYKGPEFDPSVCATALQILLGRGENVSRKDPRLAKLPELAALQRLNLAHMRLPDVAIFLDVEPALAFRRITARGEKTQVHETEEKLGELREGYLEVCGVVESECGLPMRVVGGSPDIESVIDSALSFIRECHGNREESARD